MRLRCGAHSIHQPTADNAVEPLREGLIAFMSAYRDAMSKNIKTQILHESYEKKNTNNKQQTTKQKTSEFACEETKVWYKFPENSQI